MSVRPRASEHVRVGSARWGDERLLAFALLAVLVFLVVPWWFWGLLMVAIVAVWPWQARWLREQAERDRARRG